MTSEIMNENKKQIIGMGNPTKNMELFNQSLNTNFNGSLTENMYSNIFADELQRLIDDADVKNGSFGEKQVWVSDYKGNIEFELESQTDRMKVVYNANTDEWTVDTNDGHFEGKTFNDLIDWLCDIKNTTWFGDVTNPESYYVEFETDAFEESCDDLLNENIDDELPETVEYDIYEIEDYYDEFHDWEESIVEKLRDDFGCEPLGFDYHEDGNTLYVTDIIWEDDEEEFFDDLPDEE